MNGTAAATTVLAVGQLQIRDGDVVVNAGRCAQAIEDAAAAGAELLVLPECALTGYQFDTRDDAFAASIAVDDPRLRALDRAGSAADTFFPGASRVVGPDGAVLTAPLATHCEHAVAAATVELRNARTKATVFEPGEFEIDVFAHRRPDLYGSLALDQEQSSHA